jgi:hypothetical protein
VGSPRRATRVPLCARHNRFKSRGYRYWRDTTGAWHTHRPDGTEIQAAQPRPIALLRHLVDEIALDCTGGMW